MRCGEMKNMNNKKYTLAVEKEEYPNDPIVPLDEPFVNDKGYIQNILNTPINGAAVIFSKKGSVRSNHWHREDFHYLYVMSGSMEYYERDAYSLKHSDPIIVSAGQMVFTPPKKVHKTIFIEDTVLLSFSKRNRDHESHEEDVVREEY
jgi:quercetin dioxygenase-like cupin family protein